MVLEFWFRSSSPNKDQKGTFYSDETCMHPTSNSRGESVNVGVGVFNLSTLYSTENLHISSSVYRYIFSDVNFVSSNQNTWEPY